MKRHLRRSTNIALLVFAILIVLGTALLMSACARTGTVDMIKQISRDCAFDRIRANDIDKEVEAECHQRQTRHSW